MYILGEEVVNFNVLNYGKHLINTHEIYKQFWGKVEIGKREDCWNWTGNLDRHGYGQYFYKGNTFIASRLAWILTYGNIKPNDLFVCHKCDKPRCVNPNHLFLATNHENILDKYNKGRGVNCSLRGEQHPWSKLNREKVKTIRDLYKTGNYTYQKLGGIFNVTTSCIWQIVSYRSWKI